MSQNYKPSQGKAVQPPLLEMQPADLQPKERERVAQLIAAGKSGPAVDFAKEVHKRRHSTASEALLLDAYGARLASLVERGLDKEARALMDLVRERYPSAGDRLREWNTVFAARRGDLDGLLAPLNDPSLPAGKHAAVIAWVHREAVDLRALAQCGALAPEHPLRTAAAALDKAFAAVTSGPVADEALALPEVSRHSPLAPWKMLVRAIAAFYRRDDGLCQKCLVAVEPDSAAARVTPVLRALTEQKGTGQKQTLTPAATALVSQAGGDLDHLRGALTRLDQALGRGNQSHVNQSHVNQAQIVQDINAAVAACRQTEPGLLDRLKQHISIRAIIVDIKADRVAAAMGGPCLKNAYFWRLMARAAEEEKSHRLAIPQACGMWEEYRKHAVHEGLFPAKGPEAATLYLHMADLLKHVAEEDLEEIRDEFADGSDGYADAYRGQPAQIRALMTPLWAQDWYFLSPDAVLERACEADPCAENFQRWLRYTTEDSLEERSPGAGDKVAERWCEALPNDIPPLLHLMESAEKRNSLQKAFKFMERAEAIDGLNPEVRRARLRLLVSMAARHLRQKKPHLAETELRQLDALPQVRQGDRLAFVAALRWVWSHLRGAPREAAAQYAEAVKLLGDGVTAHLLFMQVERWCERPDSELGALPGHTVPLFAAFGRVCALGDDMGMTVEIPATFSSLMMQELSLKNVSGNVQALAALGEAAIREEDVQFANAVATAGLAQGAEGHARFLFLRARALPPWEEERRSACVAVASELARRQRDSGLLNQIGEWRDEEMDIFGFPPDVKAASMSTEEIARVVQRETRERGYPKSRPASRPASLPNRRPRAAGDPDCPCPECCAARGELPAELADMPEELANMVEQFGPEVVAKAMAEMLGIGKKKRGKGRARFANDNPFF